MKHIHKLIALSGTYSQSSKVTTSMLERDANNRFFLRGPRFRMTAEMIRDNGLQVAGLLSDKMGGPPIYPPQPDGLWRQTGRNEPKYIAAQTEDPHFAARFSTFAKTLRENEDLIADELINAQGSPVDLSGYFLPDEEMASAAMRPSKFFNEALDKLSKA